MWKKKSRDYKLVEQKNKNFKKQINLAEKRCSNLMSIDRFIIWVIILKSFE